MEESSPQLPAIQSDEIESLKKRGALAVAKQRETAVLARQIAGMQWGSVSGSSLSGATQYAIARFCEITRANPLTHISILGGRPYLEATYWSDRITDHDRYHHHTQREISLSSEEGLRAQADKARRFAAELREAGGDPDLERIRTFLIQAQELELEADEVARLRAHYRPPEWATHVYETTIYRYTNAAPLEKLMAGELSEAEEARYMIEVSECNWAGGRPPGVRAEGTRSDPIGNAEPAKTARTRSLRRTAVRAFPAWLTAYDEQIRRIEHVIEADFEAVLETAEEVGEVAILASGEPAPAPEDAPEPVELPGTQEPAPQEEPPPPTEEEEGEKWNRADVHRRYFATLRDARISESDRRGWQLAHRLPASTADWGPLDYETAIEHLIEPARTEYGERCEALGYDPEDYALTQLGHLPEYLAHYNQLNAELKAEAKGARA